MKKPEGTSPKPESVDSRGVSPVRDDKSEEQVALEKKVDDLEDKVGKERYVLPGFVDKVQVHMLNLCLS